MREWRACSQTPSDSDSVELSEQSSWRSGARRERLVRRRPHEQQDGDLVAAGACGEVACARCNGSLETSLRGGTGRPWGRCWNEQRRLSEPALLMYVSSRRKSRPDNLVIDPCGHFLRCRERGLLSLAEVTTSNVPFS